MKTININGTIDVPNSTTLTRFIQICEALLNAYQVKFEGSVGLIEDKEDYLKRHKTEKTTEGNKC